MTRPSPVLPQPPVSTGRELDALAAAVERHCGPWSHDTEVDRLSLVRSEGSVEPFEVMYQPMVCFMAAGAKRVVFGEQDHVFERGTCVVTSLEVPVTSEILGAPYRAAVLQLDAAVLSDLVAEMDGARAEPRETGTTGLAGHAATPELLDAVTRLVLLLDAPEYIHLLAPRIEAEVLLRLLVGPAGPVLRQFALTKSRLTQVRWAVRWIRDHFAEPLQVADVARAASMSEASLHRHFRRSTGMSPIQFQKRLRLQEARRRLVSGEQTATSTAALVGYASPSQFSRDFARTYGLPPAQYARSSRAAPRDGHEARLS